MSDFLEPRSCHENCCHIFHNIVYASELTDYACPQPPLLVDETFSFENVVMRMAFLSDFESYKLMPGSILINAGLGPYSL